MAERQVAVFTDAGADLPSVDILSKRYGVGPIEQIPLYVTFGKDEYIVGENIDNKIYRGLVESTGLIPSTAAVNFPLFLTKYRQAEQNGLDIFSVHMGDNLGATGEHARQAGRKINSQRVMIFNSGTVSIAEGFMAIEAEKAAAEGKNLDEIYQIVDDVKRRTEFFVVTPNFPFLRKSGRVSHLLAFFGENMGIVPIIRIDNGEVPKVAKPNSMEKAINLMTEFARKKIPLEHIAIVDYNADQNVDQLIDKLTTQAKIPKEIIYRGDLGPITESHGGPETFGMMIVMAR